ncbi:MAG: hypothetical protein PHY64_00330 [Eubacteriales bacterium]|nr:hypothetical protein [Eubacteriales bacterium]
MKKRFIMIMIAIGIVIAGAIVPGEAGVYLCGFGAGAVTAIEAVELFVG